MTSKKIRISDIIIPKYYSIFNDTKHMHHILTSGRAGTKSSYAAIKVVYKVISDNNCAVIVLRKHHNKLKKTVYKEVIRAIKRLGLDKSDFKITKTPMEITYKPNGNTIYFTGSDSIDDTKGIIDEEKQIKLVVLDELTEFFDSGEGESELFNIEATFVRGNDEEFQMLYLYNPPKNPNASICEWCRKMEGREDVVHVHTDYRDVPIKWIGRKLIEGAESLREADEKLYKWIWLGLCTGIDDLVYYMFRLDIHVYNPDDIPDEENKSIGEIGIGVDYGMQNATVYEAFGVDHQRNAFRGLEEYYYSGRENGKQRSPSDYAKDMKEFCEMIEKKYNRVVSYIYIDPSASGLKEEIKRLLPHITIKNAENSVGLGIGRTQKLLSYKRLLLSKGQKMLIKELGLYQYDPKSIERGKEEVMKVNDHCMDAVRYVIMGMWNKIRNMLPVTERGGDKE